MFNFRGPRPQVEQGDSIGATVVQNSVWHLWCRVGPLSALNSGSLWESKPEIFPISDSSIFQKLEMALVAW